MEYDKLGIVRQPSGTGLAKVAPSNIYPTKDGKYLVIAANLDPMFNRLCEAMGKPELSSDPKFDTHMSRGENAEELDALIGEWTKNMTTAQLDKHLDSHGVVTGPIYTIADIAKDKHFKDREMVLKYSDQHFGELAIPGVAPKLSHTEPKISWLGPQEVGAHNQEIYGGLLNIADEELEDLSEKGII